MTESAVYEVLATITDMATKSNYESPSKDIKDEMDCLVSRVEYRGGWTTRVEDGLVTATSPSEFRIVIRNHPICIAGGLDSAGCPCGVHLTYGPLSNSHAVPINDLPVPYSPKVILWLCDQLI